MTAEDYEKSGDMALNNGDYYTAFVQYNKSLDLKPENLRISYKKGLIYLLTGKNEQAVKEFEGVIKKDPGKAWVYEGLGEAYFQMNQHAQAEENFQKALELDPKRWKARNFLGNIYDYQEL